jgi:hypothetical protein
MIKTHRAIFERLGPGPVPGVILDTPYRFQENAADISARAVAYFEASVGRTVGVAGLGRADEGDPLAHQSALATVAAAQWVFAGPGSPTYALRQWRTTDLPGLLADKLANGGCIVFASAAALTLGALTVPVYEIYKVGDDPTWAPGLDLLSDILGPNVAVIPHWDNAEGGTHDTHYCYLGERRLRLLEDQQPPDGWILGVDEHTGLIIDLDDSSAAVVGNGQVTVRHHGRSAALPTGTTLELAELVQLARALPAGRAATPVPVTAEVAEASGNPPAGQAGEPAAPTLLHREIRRLDDEFDEAFARGDPAGAARTMLDLDEALAAWSGDTTQSDAAERGRAALRRMTARLGEVAAEGTRDPVELIGPYVDALLAERDAARGERRFADADRIRQRLVALGLQIHDHPDGTTWTLH